MIEKSKVDRYAHRLVRRWLRVARHAAEVRNTDALLRFRLEGGLQEVSRARRDIANGEYQRLLVRARCTAMRRLRPRVEAELLQLRRQHPTWGCCRLSRGMEARGLPLSVSSVCKILRRKGLPGVRAQRAAAR